MKKFTAEEVMEELLATVMESLEDLTDVRNALGEQFAYGEKTAFVEIAEILQRWEKASAYGLNFNIEDKYPL